MDILLGISLVLIGLAITFMGVRIFFAILPLLAFVFGFFAGAALIHEWLGDGFLRTVAGWIVGIALGVGLALISWLWWYFGVLVSAGAVGSLIGTTLASLFSIDSDWAIYLLALAGFALAFAGAWALNLPVYLIILETGLAGATVLVTGLLLILNQIDRDDLTYGTAVATINASWWWLLVSFVVAVVGIAYQLTMRDAARFPENRWTSAGTPGLAA